MVWMDKDGDSKISKAEYMEAMDFLTTILTDEDFEHGVLETLATKASVADMPNRAAKLMALFKHLDVDGGGALELDELLAVANDANPAADQKAAKAQLAWLDGRVGYHSSPRYCGASQNTVH
jgi:Ca2+-binding EF-hand superfamily protein